MRCQVNKCLRLPRLVLALLIGTLGMASCGWAQEGNDSKPDWLIDGETFKAGFRTDPQSPGRFQLSNGLVSRTFLLHDGIGATIGLDCLATDQAVLRSVKPEAIVSINGTRYPVGGLSGQPNHAYLLDEWLAEMKPAENALRLVNMHVGKPEERFGWKRVRRHESSAAWPPPGVKLTLEFAPQPEPESKPGVPGRSGDNSGDPKGNATAFRVQVHYELYDGVPVFCKWITVTNNGQQTLVVDKFTSELLGVVEHDSRVEFREGVDYPEPESIHVETDFAFGGFSHDNANRHVVHWRTDPEYTTQVNYAKQAKVLLAVEPTYGPAQSVAPGESFSSCRAFELLHDSSDRERRSLSIRKMYRTIAPWVTENPLMHHLKVSKPAEVRRAIDDAAKVGFEMIILSFGSGFNIENEDPVYVQQWREINDYAKSKGIEIGGYSLLSSRRIGGGNDIVPPEGVKLTHGNCPALASPWGLEYYEKLHRFFETTGFSLLEHDGPYPGDVDVTERLPLQKGESDSRWVQAKIANEFYQWCRERGIYVNAPDYYYLNGTNKCGMGYREVNWSLPRAMQVIHTRQNIYDGTWSKTPSMGWMFVPLSEYHGGGAAATIEPLREHLDHYERMIDSNLGMGVQACYRGPRLFDADATMTLLKSKVEWFKRHRDILESDVIHGRRPDGRDLDWILHANPRLDHKGMIMVYNPTEKEIRKTISVNLYYTGLFGKANVSEMGASPASYSLARDYSIDLPVTVPANSMRWYTVQ
ncbi:MAG: hypothetical protein ACI814_003212 [Mariniblastus sp.]|jgi:hypothetical protein